MLKFIIRLDDAAPNMNKVNWDRIENLLDKYNIKPIVGLIPDCKDEEFKKYAKIENFWTDYALNYQKKGWIIAQHGFNHNLSKDIRTEFSNRDYSEQYNILSEGYKILKKNNIIPMCFFAPNHTFDDNTIKACNELGVYKFISDGYAIYPYKYNGMLFFPSVFDTPHKILPFGIWTFVYHPNNMSDEDFNYLEDFIIKNRDNFDVDFNFLLNKYKNRKKKPYDFVIEFMIMFFRKVRNKNG